jgi:hypothetical protein
MKIRKAAVIQRCKSLYCIGTAAFCFFAEPLNATGPFEVDVEVTIDGVSADVAKTQAFEEGKRQAWQKLLKNLTLKGYGEISLKSVDIDSLLDDFRVKSEKVSPSHYYAQLTYNFTPESVRQLLKKARIAYSEVNGPKVLMIPMTRQKGSLSLWEDNNHWKNLWQDTSSGEGSLSWVVPLGDLEDQGLGTADQVLESEEIRQKLMLRYGAQEVAFCILEIDDKIPSSLPQMKVTFKSNILSLKEDTLPSNFDLREEGASYIQKLKEEKEEEWKRGHLSEEGKSHKIVVRVIFKSLEEWESLRQRLESISLIKKLTLQLFSREEALVEIDFMGDETYLNQLLANYSLKLSQDEGLEPLLVYTSHSLER